MMRKVNNINKTFVSVFTKIEYHIYTHYRIHIFDGKANIMGQHRELHQNDQVIIRPSILMSTPFSFSASGQNGCMFKASLFLESNAISFFVMAISLLLPFYFFYPHEHC